VKVSEDTLHVTLIPLFLLFPEQSRTRGTVHGKRSA
jgi:hypothetical protein